MLKKVLKGFRAFVLTIRGHVNISGKTYSITVFNLNQIIKAIVNRKSYEVELDYFLQHALSLKEGAFLDIGANIGQTLIKLLSIDASRRYIGFEPQVLSCSYINRFITDNGLKDYTIFPIGLADKTGIAKLGTRTHNDATASIVDEYRPQGFHTTHNYIPVFTGDEIVEQINPDAIALVKIDVEGGELEVLKGMSSTLSRYRPFLIFELLPHYLLLTKTTLDPHIREVRDARYKKIDHFIRSFEYTLFRIKPGGRLFEVPELKAAERESHNYLAVPQEHIDSFNVGRQW